MRWFDLISSIIFSSVVHAFNSSCLNELCGHAASRVREWDMMCCFGRMLGEGRAAVGLCWCWCFTVKHAVFAPWFWLGTIEISLSPVQNGQIHTSDRGHCATHCKLGNTAKEEVFKMLTVHFLCRLFKRYMIVFTVTIGYIIVRTS